MTQSVNSYLIGHVDKKYYHPGAGRYTEFRKWISLDFIRIPIHSRFLRNKYMNKIEYFVFRSLGRKGSAWWYPYSYGLMIQELTVFIKMWLTNEGVFHSVKGEVDIHHLPIWSRHTRSRLIVTYHDAVDNFGNESLTSDFLRNVDGIVALCESQRSFFTQRMNPDRVRVVPHGVNTNFFKPAEKLLESFRVISVGSYCRDYKTFNTVMSEVWQKLPNVEFLIVGTGTRPEDVLEKVKDSRVQYMDGISDTELLNLYRSSNIAAISLYAATANNALLEAMSCGLPVVATNTGGIKEYLGEDSGLLVPEFDSINFAEAIVSILSNQDRAVLMGISGRKRAVKYFDYAVVASEMNRFYEDVRRWPQAPALPM